LPPWILQLFVAQRRFLSGRCNTQVDCPVGAALARLFAQRCRGPRAWRGDCVLTVPVYARARPKQPKSPSLPTLDSPLHVFAVVGSVQRCHLPPAKYRYGFPRGIDSPDDADALALTFARKIAAPPHPGSRPPFVRPLTRWSWS
jgi:hypothetical protein